MEERLPKQAGLPQRNPHARGRVPLIVLGALVVAGFVAGVFWQRHQTALRQPPGMAPAHNLGLAESTIRQITNLPVPVEIRFYALFNDKPPSDTLRDFAVRIGSLLTAFEQAGRGKITVVRREEWSAEAAQSAGADGIRPQNLDRDEPFYLGVALLAETRREALSHLRPEWEAALEFDLARALDRLTQPSTLPPATDTEAEAAAAREAVQRALPNLASLSLEEARDRLREDGRKAFETAVAAMQKELQVVQERIKKAEAAGDEAARQAGLQELQQIRARHTEWLGENARRLQAQVEALDHLKRD
ncbi:MAG TPA: Gldg family protein [Verrucomicrobiota bacterium]|nr:MAG: ABC-type uncharacterized transport system [Verrucomicrobia bacterium ADurb.Bin118]HPY30919.1 Gldg family protein [Verrucomicrobiota bacterium]HQB17371.1 Gldg family protein [Verrucomicrobiota bacterium]